MLLCPITLQKGSTWLLQWSLGTHAPIFPLWQFQCIHGFHFQGYLMFQNSCWSSSHHILKEGSRKKYDNAAKGFFPVVYTLEENSVRVPHNFHLHLIIRNLVVWPFQTVRKCNVQCSVFDGSLGSQATIVPTGVREKNIKERLKREPRNRKA